MPSRRPSWSSERADPCGQPHPTRRQISFGQWKQNSPLDFPCAKSYFSAESLSTFAFFLFSAIQTFHRRIIDGGRVFALIPWSSIGKTSRTLPVQTGFVNPAKFPKENLFAFSAHRVQRGKGLEKNQGCLLPTEKIFSNEKIERKWRIRKTRNDFRRHWTLARWIQSGFSNCAIYRRSRWPSFSIRFQRNF